MKANSNTDCTYYVLNSQRVNEICENGDCVNKSDKKCRGFCQKCYQEFKEKAVNKGDEFCFLALLASIIRDSDKQLEKIKIEFGLTLKKQIKRGGKRDIKKTTH